jgi:hypothetical protein
LKVVAAVALFAALPGFFTGWATGACSALTVAVAVYVLVSGRKAS